MNLTAHQTAHTNRPGDMLARVDTLFERAKHIARQKAEKSVPREDFSPRTTAELLETQEAHSALASIESLAGDSGDLTGFGESFIGHEGLTPERVAKLLEL